jgi:CheY-like chemotaxis protein
MTGGSPIKRLDGHAKKERKLSVFDRWTEEELTDLLRTLDDRDARLARDGASNATHWSYRKRLTVTLYPDSPVPSTMLVQARTLHSTAGNFIAPAMVYPATRCSVQLLTGHNMWHDATGLITNCRYVGERAYEIAVTFANPIELVLFVPQAIIRKVLVVDDEVTSRGLLSLQIKRLNAEVTAVASGAEAVQLCKGDAFDAVFVDLEMPELDGFETLRQLRASGFSGRCIAVSSYMDTETTGKCQAAGFNAFLPKPVVPDTLAEALHATVEPVLSNFANDPDMRPLIQGFVDSVPALLEELAECIYREDVEGVHRSAQRLQADAAGCGFEPVADLAANVVNALSAGEPLSEVRPKLTQLTDISRQVRATTAS